MQHFGPLIANLIVLVVCAGAFVLPVLGQDRNADQKPPKVESGYITKIDIKKKVLTVQGFVKSLPEDIPGHKENAGREGGTQVSVTGSRGSDSGAKSGHNTTSAIAVDGTKPDRVREIKVYIDGDTVIQQGATVLELKELKVQDYVMVVGTAKGSAGVTADSIAVSAR